MLTLERGRGDQRVKRRSDQRAGAGCDAERRDAGERAWRWNNVQKKPRRGAGLRCKWNAEA